LAVDGRALRIGAAIVGDVELDALHLGFSTSNIDGQSQVAMATWIFVVLGRHRHHLRAAPGDGPHIAGLELVGLDAGGLGRVQLLDGIGDFEIEHLGRFFEALECSVDLKIWPP
jgi:hypothetical protein